MGDDESGAGARLARAITVQAMIVPRIDALDPMSISACMNQ